MRLEGGLAGRMDTTKTWMETVGKVGLVLLVALLVIVSYLMYHAGRFKGISDINAMDYGQVARNLANGDGYTTKIVRPLSLARVPRIEKHPELTLSPVHPWIAAQFMKLMPDDSRALALSCGLGFLLTAPVVFFLGWQFFDIRTGYLATALYATNLLLLGYSISGLETTWLCLWVSLLFLVLHALARKQRWRLVLATIAGLLMGLIYLTQVLWIVVLPLIAIYILVSSDRLGRWTTLLVFLVVFAVVIAPWCVRNVNVVGDPFFNFRAAESIMGTRTHPGNTLYRQFIDEYPSWPWYVLDRPVEILEKLRDGIAALYNVLPGIAGLYVTPFFLVAVIVTLGPRAFERMRYLWYSIFIVMAIALALVSPDTRQLAPLAPFAIVIAAGFFLRLLNARIDEPVEERRMRLLRIGMGVLLVINALPVGLELFRFREITPDQRMLIGTAQSAREVTATTTGPILTDAPWTIAWFGDRTAIWLPKTRGDLRNMEDKVGKIRWMLLTPAVANPALDATERMLKEWGPAYAVNLAEDRDFEGYVTSKRLSLGRWVLLEADPNAKRDLPPEVLERMQPRENASGADSPAGGNAQ